MNWQAALVVLLALAIGFGVLARIVARDEATVEPATPDPARVTAPGD